MYPAPSDTPSFTNLTGIKEELSTTLLVLDSLFPVAKILPGLTKDKRSFYYYLHGKIEPSHLESLYNYAGRIGELTLGAEPDATESRLAPQVLARIGQLQDPNKPLFPVLHHLRVVATSSLLHFLDLFLSASLMTLELTGICDTDPCYSSLLSFVECAVHQSPNLSTLILGPGIIQEQILDISLKFKNLHCLELRDVGISITDQLLRDIGSIQRLETFILRDDGTSIYTRSPAVGASTMVVSASFPALRTLKIGGTFELIEDLVAKVSSTDLRVLSIDITKSLQRIRPVPVAGELLYLEDDFPTSRALRMGKEKTKFRVTVEPPYSEDDGPVLLRSLRTGMKKKRKILLSTSPPPTPELSTTDIMMYLRCSTEKWPKTLVSVSFKSVSTTSFTLPSGIFEDILLRPDMKHLEIIGMSIDSMEGSLGRLEEVEDSKLEVLHLPVHPTAPAISLAQLRDIAKACSRLKSLHCRLLRIQDLSDMLVSPPLSHHLGVLSVSNEAPLKYDSLRGIARYLDSIFPKLKSITAHGNSDTRQWRGVYELMQSFQAVRMDEQLRLGLEPEK